MSQLGDRDMMKKFPLDLISCILDRLSVYDRARTSAVSREWRQLWRMSFHLRLDKSLFSQLTCNKDKDAHQSVIVRALEMIFLSRIGLIQSISLYIPPNLDQCPVARWKDHIFNPRIRCYSPNYKPKRPFNMTKFIGNLPRIYAFCTNGFALQVDDKRANPPDLASNLDSVDLKGTSLCQLHTVDVLGVTASNYVFHLVKLLLASAPSLKVMSLHCSGEVIDPGERLKIKQELQGFPKCSSGAQILLLGFSSK
ncbi:hypothetical protein ACET3Z_027497 [Daucus carota]